MWTQEAQGTRSNPKDTKIQTYGDMGLPKGYGPKEAAAARSHQ